jgi:hypothetical protein
MHIYNIAYGMSSDNVALAGTVGEGRVRRYGVPREAAVVSTAKKERRPLAHGGAR